MPDCGLACSDQGRTFDFPFAEGNLDRVLVAGLILEVILASPGLPVESQSRRILIKSRVQHALLGHLAGRVTLQRFQELARLLDRWFPYYYPLISTSAPALKGISPAPPSLPSPREALKEDLLAQWLSQNPHLFPRRRHRKLHQSGLKEFLHLNRGNSFRVKDFQEFFRLDRKTAWEYLKKFWHAGLLAHNQGRSAAVRYSLAPGFFKV